MTHAAAVAAEGVAVVAEIVRTEIAAVAAGQTQTEVGRIVAVVVAAAFEIHCQTWLLLF